MRYPRRFGLQGRLHDGGDLVDWIGGFSSPARSDIPQTVQPLVTKALSPKNDRISIHRKPLRNGNIGVTRNGGQNDTATQSHLLWSAMGRDPLLEFLPLHFGKLTRPPHAPGYCELAQSVYLFVGHNTSIHTFLPYDPY